MLDADRYPCQYCHRLGHWLHDIDVERKKATFVNLEVQTLGESGLVDKVTEISCQKRQIEGQLGRETDFDPPPAPNPPDLDKRLRRLPVRFVEL